MELKACPFCGKTVRVRGPEDWHPTFHDPDSGGDPYSIECDCGLSFCINSYDFDETAKAWNNRVSVSRGVLDQIRWERDIAIKQLAEIGKSLGEKMDDITGGSSMEITVSMNANEFMEFMAWRKDKSVVGEDLRKAGKEIEDLANKVFEALEECASGDVPEVKIKNQQAAIRLIRDAAEVF